jgi:hypothetical protein
MTRPLTPTATVSRELSPGFRDVLKSRREDFNRRFVVHSHLAGGLDAQAFLTHLADVVDPILRSISEVLPECVPGGATELFDLSLELFSAGGLGPEAKSHEIEDVWSTILPDIPRLMARNASQTAGLLSNVAFNVARQESAHIADWLTTMQQLAPKCESTARLRDCCIAVAWRVGMPQYRHAALQTLAQLDSALACGALGLPAATTPGQLARVCERLQESVWNRIELDPPRSTTRLQIVRTVGRFRGFGGEFLRPPRASCAEGSLLISDSQSRWQLLADCYGAHFHRIGPAPRPSRRHRRESPAISCEDPVRIGRDGTLTWKRLQERFPELQNATSAASDGQTLAVTIEDSHHVFLVAAV